jgi:hypothetical protein
MYGRILLATALLLSTACKQRSSSKAKSDQSSDTATCEDGSQPVSYTLKPIDPMPSASVIDFGDDVPYKLVPHGENSVAARVDICINESEGTAEVARLMLRDNPTRPTIDARISKSATAIEVDGNVYSVPASEVQAENVDAAAFGDPSALLIYVPVRDVDGILIKSWKDGELVFTTAVRAMKKDGKLKPNSINLITGSFDSGNPFKEGPCKDGQAEFTKTFAFEKVTLKVAGCYYQGGGETMGYDIHKVEVADKSAVLSAEQQENFVLEGDKLKEAFKYQWNHHNACDSWVLTLPHAKYAASAGPMAGCGRVLEGAPERDFQEENRDTKYIIRYNNGTPLEGSVPSCSHFIFNCTQSEPE